MATNVLGFVGGAVATLSIGRCHPPLHPTLGEVRRSVLGSRGSIVTDEARPALSVYGVPGIRVVERYLYSDEDIVKGSVERWVRWIRGGENPGQSVGARCA